MKTALATAALILSLYCHLSGQDSSITFHALENVRKELSRDIELEKHPGSFLKLGRNLSIKKSSIELIEATSNSIELTLSSGLVILITADKMMFDSEALIETIEQAIQGEREVIKTNSGDLIRITEAVKYYYPHEGQETSNVALRSLRKTYFKCLRWDYITDYCEISRKTVEP